MKTISMQQKCQDCRILRSAIEQKQKKIKLIIKENIAQKNRREAQFQEQLHSERIKLKQNTQRYSDMLATVKNQQTQQELKETRFSELNDQLVQLNEKVQFLQQQISKSEQTKRSLKERYQLQKKENQDLNKVMKAMKQKVKISHDNKNQDLEQKCKLIQSLQQQIAVTNKISRSISAKDVGRKKLLFRTRLLFELAIDPTPGKYSQQQFIALKQRLSEQQQELKGQRLQFKQLQKKYILAKVNKLKAEGGQEFSSIVKNLFQQVQNLNQELEKSTSQCQLQLRRALARESEINYNLNKQLTLLDIKLRCTVKIHEDEKAQLKQKYKEDTASLRKTLADLRKKVSTLTDRLQKQERVMKRGSPRVNLKDQTLDLSLSRLKPQPASRSNRNSKQSF